MKSLLLAAASMTALQADEASRSTQLLLASPLPAVIGLGESAHDDPASLAWRNELVLALVGQGAARLILMETGFAEGRLLDAFVQGKGPLTSETLSRGFTNGLGMFTENRELIEALRTINLSRPAQDRVHVAGIDLSGGGPCDAAPGMPPVDCALEAVTAAARTGLRSAFEKALKPGLEGATVTPAQVRAYGSLVTRLEAAVPGSAGFEQQLCLRIVGQGAKLLTTLPPASAGAGLPRSAWRNIEVRDRSMAENVLLMARRSPGRPVLLLSHLSHVAKTPMQGPRWSRLARSPRSMGYFLAARLGAGYRAMIEVTSTDPSTCSALSGAQLFESAKAPEKTCPVTINGSDTQVIDLRRSADFIRARLPSP